MVTGIKLQHAFQKQSIGARGEIALFRAFIQAFNGLGAEALAKEYHGNRYQVIFQQARGAGRPLPRCELCDVLIINYPAGDPTAARITFNQAKVSSKQFGCRGGVRGKPYRFRGNLEQWDLLSNRPLISPATRTFLPPADLLSGSLLPSVGTFGVFYPVGAGFDFAYFVADGLSALNNGSGRSGTLEWNNPVHQLRKISGYTEVTGTCCMQTFGDALLSGHVGTPISQLLMNSASPFELRAWLAGMLVTLSQEHRDSQLPEELLEGLELDRKADDIMSFGEERPKPIRAVILVRGNRQES
ncbi:hypothetical protein KUV22_02280 [Microbulbifer agarilyticus]|uniref:hypothetical protein n=1 Tax=Microbulbifer agarilyticus TaxID=260552 RepID=UPI001C981E03|nr:hypothetical protein [Microbulbifer agarilyticus]MBY6189236.1 hypothetical protein [Microbulbifer agarilyticus]